LLFIALNTMVRQPTQVKGSLVERAVFGPDGPRYVADAVGVWEVIAREDPAVIELYRRRIPQVAVGAVSPDDDLIFHIPRRALIVAEDGSNTVGLLTIAVGAENPAAAKQD